jgi:hypothetical protein
VTVGQSSTHINNILNVLRGTAYTGVTPYLKLHTGDPGATATANASTETSRKALVFAAPSANAVTSSAVSWTAWSATSGEVISYYSIWDASTAGNFLISGQFGTSKTVTTGDTLNATITVSQGPAAA